MSSVLGVVIIARNGDRRAFYQDPQTYAPGLTDSTALGVADLHLLGTQLRSTYLTTGSPAFIPSISRDVADTQEVKVLVKAGGEGAVVFDSAIALLQGLFPPNPRNQVKLANGTTVSAPLGGYQYVPMETVEPGNDRSLESWTDCPEFQKHVTAFYESDAFKKEEKSAASFLHEVKDFVFGRPATLKNIWNIYDYMNTELIYNQTYAYRLPPTYINQARALADFHENGVFSDAEANGIGNIAGRSLLHTILDSVERIAFDDDPLKLMVIQTSYQPFISLFHQTEMVKEHPHLAAIPNFGAALAIELRRGLPPDMRDFLRFKFRNGTDDPEDWQLVHPFGHRADIPLTEFVYRTEGTTIANNKEWAHVCGATTEFSTTTTVMQIARRGSIQFSMGAIIFLLLAIVVKTLLRTRARRTALTKVHGPQMIECSRAEKQEV
ncbi:histidine phosphatase superfamily [Mycena metata]|uniref:Histidine phosphatase superfamily n=1 Tax=Mycena metata TaxID=1033252 RepID=A0AAD7HRM0_9AGAR|nr:histidine phosphatase superfamily [Mycena metata]